MLVNVAKPGLVMWLAFGAIAATVPGSLTDLRLPLTAIAGFAHSTYAFVALGGLRVTAGGIVVLANALFGFFPALLVAVNGPDFATTGTAEAAAWIYFSQVVLVGWWSSSLSRTPIHVVAAGNQRVGAAWAVFLGLAAFMGGIFLKVSLGMGSTSLAGAATFTGALLLAIAALTSQTRLSPFQVALAAGAGLAYAATMFTGGGRLVLGALAAALLLAINLVRPRLWHKLATVIALPAGLTLLAAHRSASVASSRGGNESGLESVYWPFERFAQLVQMAHHGQLQPAWGESLIAPLVFFVPRSVWESKPIGFGAELANIFRPELEGSGHSEAALMYGEAVYNFGVAGLVLLVPVLGVIVTLIDRLLDYTARLGTAEPQAGLTRLVAVLLAAGLLDLVWVGTFGFATRTGMRLIVAGCFAVLLLVFGLLRRDPSESSADHRAAG